MSEDLSSGQTDQQPKYYGPNQNEIGSQPDTHQAIEAALVRGIIDPDAKADEERNRSLHSRIPQPPLTEEDIAKLTQHRGQRPTEEEIRGMNQAREQGIHTSIV